MTHIMHRRKGFSFVSKINQTPIYKITMDLHASKKPKTTLYHTIDYYASIAPIDVYIRQFHPVFAYTG